jgi:hypothetical protein
MHEHYLLSANQFTGVRKIPLQICDSFSRLPLRPLEVSKFVKQSTTGSEVDGGGDHQASFEEVPQNQKYA